MTWNELAAAHPEFVQWIVATFGPLPDGPVREDDYNRFKVAYETALIDGFAPPLHGGGQGETPEKLDAHDDGSPSSSEASQ